MEAVSKWSSLDMKEAFAAYADLDFRQKGHVENPDWLNLLASLYKD